MTDITVVNANEYFAQVCAQKARLEEKIVELTRELKGRQELLELGKKEYETLSQKYIGVVHELTEAQYDRKTRDDQLTSARQSQFKAERERDEMKDECRRIATGYREAEEREAQKLKLAMEENKRFREEREGIRDEQKVLEEKLNDETEYIGHFIEKIVSLREEDEKVRKMFDVTRHRVLERLGERNMGKTWSWVESRCKELVGKESEIGRLKKALAGICLTERETTSSDSEKVKSMYRVARSSLGKVEVVCEKTKEEVVDMKRVYICHPYSDDPAGNAEKVRVICRSLAERGFNPIAPQLYLNQLVLEDTQRELAMKICLDLVKMCDEVWVYGEPPAGMRQELELCSRMSKPVKRV